MSLLQRIKVNDQQAWTRLVSIYGRLVYYWCQRSGIPPREIPDLVQDVFQAVYRGIEQFERRTNHGSFRGWLKTITLNKLRDHARREKREAVAAGGTAAREKLLQVAENDFAVLDDSSDSDHNMIVRQVIKVLEGDFAATTWKAFRMTAFDGMTSPEVAQALGISANAVRHAKARVLRKLREELEGLVEL